MSGLGGAGIGNAPVVVQLRTLSETLHTNAVIPALGTIMAIEEYSNGFIHVTSTAITSAELIPEISENGTDYVACEVRNILTGELLPQIDIGPNANEIWEVQVAGASNFRVRLAAIVPAAGVVNVTSKVTSGSSANLRPMASDAGILDNSVQRVTVASDKEVDSCDSVVGWTLSALGSANLATDTNHTFGLRSIKFDKIAGDVEASISRTGLTIDASGFNPLDVPSCSLYLPNLANIVYSFIRLGTDAANYSEWRLPVIEMTAAEWLLFSPTLGSVNAVVGNGCNLADVRFAALGVVFNAAGDVLADMLFDHLYLRKILPSSAIINAEISTEISSADINVERVGNVQTAVDHGVSNLGTQRVASNPIPGQSGVASGAGIIDTDVQRSTIATDLLISSCDAIGTWVASLGAGGLGLTLDHVFGTGAFDFDKIAGNVLALIGDPGGINVDASGFNPSDVIALSYNIPNIADVVKIIVRLGTDNANYNEWERPVADITAAVWEEWAPVIGQPDAFLGNGMNPATIGYAAFGVEFALAADTLSNILVDHLYLKKTLSTDAQATSDVNLVELDGNAVSLDEGVSDAGTQRIWSNSIAGQVGVQAGAGAADALTQRVIPANDSPTYGEDDSAAPTYAEQVAGKFESVPVLREDGDLVVPGMTAYAFAKIGGYSPAGDWLKMSEQVPWGMDFDEFVALNAVVANTVSSTFDITNYKTVLAVIHATGITSGGLIDFRGSYDGGTTFTPIEYHPIVEADTFFVNLPAGLTHIRSALSNRTDGTYTVRFIVKGGGGQNDGRKRFRYGPWVLAYSHAVNAITNVTWVSSSQAISCEGAIAIEWEINPFTFNVNGCDIRWAWRDYNDAAYITSLDAAAASDQIALAASVTGKMPHTTPKGRMGVIQTYGNGVPGGATVLSVYARALYDTV